MDFSVQDNTDQIKKAAEQAVKRAMRMIGGQAEKHAKALCPVGTVESTGKKGYRGGTLRNSITHYEDDLSTTVGSNVEYAPYVELGTGPFFTPPPDWEKFDTPKGSGIGHGYVKPRKFLQPAMADHLDEYENILKSELQNA